MLELEEDYNAVIHYQDECINQTSRFQIKPELAYAHFLAYLRKHNKSRVSLELVAKVECKPVQILLVTHEAEESR